MHPPDPEPGVERRPESQESIRGFRQPPVRGGFALCLALFLLLAGTCYYRSFGLVRLIGISQAQVHRRLGQPYSGAQAYPYWDDVFFRRSEGMGIDSVFIGVRYDGGHVVEAAEFSSDSNAEGKGQILQLATKPPPSP